MRGLATWITITTLLIPASVGAQCLVPDAQIESIELLSQIDPDELIAEVSVSGAVTGGTDFCFVRADADQPRSVEGGFAVERFVVGPNETVAFELVCEHLNTWYEPDAPTALKMKTCTRVVDQASIVTTRPTRHEISLRAGQRACTSVPSARPVRRAFLGVGRFEQDAGRACVSLPLWFQHPAHTPYLVRPGRTTEVLLEHEHTVVGVQVGKHTEVLFTLFACFLSMLLLGLSRAWRARRWFAVFRDPVRGGFRESARANLCRVRSPRRVRDLGGPFTSSQLKLHIGASGVRFDGEDLVVADPEGALAYVASSSTVPFGSTLLVEGRSLLLQRQAALTTLERSDVSLQTIAATDIERALSGSPNLLTERRVTARDVLPVLTVTALAPLVPRLLFSFWSDAGQTPVAYSLVAAASLTLFALCRAGDATLSRSRITGA